MAPSFFTLWWLANRPKTLTIAVIPVAVGAALAYADIGTISVFPVVAALFGAVFIQAGTNLHNDAKDFERGTDTPERQGPKRVTAEGWATAAEVKRAAYLSFSLAAAVGLYLVYEGGWPILLLGICSILAGLAYTGGPKPIAYTGLGEAFVFVFFGLGAVLGTYWLQTHTVTEATVIIASALGLPAAAVLAVNNYRDLETDKKNGKITLAVRIGRTASKWEYAALMLLPFALLAMQSQWLPLLLCPIALVLCKQFVTLPPGPAFNTLLARTAQFQLALGILISVGVNL